MIVKFVRVVMRGSVVLPFFATIFLLPAAASAQAGGNGFSLGFGGGFARASGEDVPYILVGSPLPDMGGIGYYMQATLETPSPFRMIRPRADLFFADWGEHVTGLTGNLLLTPVVTKRFAPYVLAGAGGYAMQGYRVRSGWTIGAGLRLPGEKWSVNIETRVHSFVKTVTGTSDKKWRSVFTPIGLGIQF